MPADPSSPKSRAEALIKSLLTKSVLAGQPGFRLMSEVERHFRLAQQADTEAVERKLRQKIGKLRADLGKAMEERRGR